MKRNQTSTFETKKLLSLKDKISSVLALILLLIFSFAHAQNSNLNDSNLIDSFIKAKGYNHPIVFDDSNIKQYWVDNFVVSQNGLIKVLNKTPVFPLLKIQLANVNETQDCKIEMITETPDVAFSIYAVSAYSSQKKIISSSVQDDDFIKYHVFSSSFHLAETPDMAFYVKFSTPSSEIRIKKIILSFEGNKTDVGAIDTNQIRFAISSVKENNGKMLFEGMCFLNDQDTPRYTILIDGKEAKTEINGLLFRAEAPRVENKAEVEICFKGHAPMPSGTWIKPSGTGFEAESIAGVPSKIRGLPEGSVLKAWDFEHDVLVYKDGARLLWLIGEEIDNNIEIIYHIRTDEPEKLPARRVQYGYDNRGFRAKTDERTANELDPIGHYRVFAREIPKDYHVTAINVGFAMNRKIVWHKEFKP